MDDSKGQSSNVTAMDTGSGGANNNSNASPVRGDTMNLQAENSNNVHSNSPAITSQQENTKMTEDGDGEPTPPVSPLSVPTAANTEHNRRPIVNSNGRLGLGRGLRLDLIEHTLKILNDRRSIENFNGRLGLGRGPHPEVIEHCRKLLEDHNYRVFNRVICNSSNNNNNNNSSNNNTAASNTSKMAEGDTADSKPETLENGGNSNSPAATSSAEGTQTTEDSDDGYSPWNDDSLENILYRLRKKLNSYFNNSSNNRNANASNNSKTAAGETTESKPETSENGANSSSPAATSAAESTKTTEDADGASGETSTSQSLVPTLIADWNRRSIHDPIESFLWRNELRNRVRKILNRDVNNSSNNNNKRNNNGGDNSKMAAGETSESKPESLENGASPSSSAITSPLESTKTAEDGDGGGPGSAAPISPLLVPTAIAEYNRRSINSTEHFALRSELLQRCTQILNRDINNSSNNNNNNNNNDNVNNVGNNDNGDLGVNDSATNDNYSIVGGPLASPTGCGCVIRATSPESEEITLSITPTTGGQFDLSVDRNETIENLKKIISKRLKVAKERICLLHRERQLREGTLRENRLQDGSKLTLLPSVETGLMGQRPEQSVMQALESLNDSQVNDFLSGKAPLNLTMRLGDQMMLIQLQLSTVTPASPSATSASNGSSSNSTSGTGTMTTPSCPPMTSATVDGLSVGGQNIPMLMNNSSAMQTSPSCHTTGTSGSSSSYSSSTSLFSLRSVNPRKSAFLSARAARARSLMSRLEKFFGDAEAAAMTKNSMTSAPTSPSNPTGSIATATTTTASNSSQSLEGPTSPSSSPTFLPIIGSSRLARPPFYRPSGSPTSSPGSTSGGSTSTGTSSSTSSPSSSSSTSSSASSTPSGNVTRYTYRKICPGKYTGKYQPKRPHYHHHHHHHHHHSRKNCADSAASNSLPNSPFPASESPQQNQETDQILQEDDPMSNGLPPSNTPKKDLCNHHHHHHHHHLHSQQQQQQQQQNSGQETNSMIVDPPGSPQSPNANGISTGNSSKVSSTLDTRALAEASRNLTQKLKQLSSEVLTSRVDLAEEHARRRQGAIIESMHHHGKGVYSGTFSGTLNPALQDHHGRPKRDISTIIHILNDLLCATPATSAGPYRHRHISGCLQRSSSNIPGTSDGAPANGSSSTGSNSGSYHHEELSKENEATKGKMRRLRLVMEQRKAKRKARRQARAAPYMTQWAAVTPDPSSNHEGGSTAASSGGNSSETQNEPELQPCSPEPVVA